MSEEREFASLSPPSSLMTASCSLLVQCGKKVMLMSSAVLHAVRLAVTHFSGSRDAAKWVASDSRVLVMRQGHQHPLFVPTLDRAKQNAVIKR